MDLIEVLVFTIFTLSMVNTVMAILLTKKVIAKHRKRVIKDDI